MNNDPIARFQEFLARAEKQPDRSHQREVYTRQASDWKITRLAP
jgi:pyridoxine/pyridoxamine 5'-phosphate oxidase